MSAILPGGAPYENSSSESEDEGYATADGGDNDGGIDSAPSVVEVPDPNRVDPTLADLERELRRVRSENRNLIAQNQANRASAASQSESSGGGERKRSDGDDEEQKPGVTANTGARVKTDPDAAPPTKLGRWAKRVRTEVLYAGEQDVIAWDAFNPMRDAQPPVASSYALEMDWATPLSYWFVSRVLRTSRIGKLFIMPPDWKDYEDDGVREDRVRVVMRLATAPHFQEGLRVAAREALPQHIDIGHITAPTRVSATYGNNIVNGAEDLNNDHLAATDIFLQAVRAGMDLTSYDAGIQQYTTSAAAREQFALLQVRKRNYLATAKQKLSQYAYDPRTKQLVSKSKSTPSYHRSAMGLMSWPQYKRFRESPSLQQGLLAENINNAERLVTRVG